MKSNSEFVYTCRRLIGLSLSDCRVKKQQISQEELNMQQLLAVFEPQLGKEAVGKAYIAAASHDNQMQDAVKDLESQVRAEATPTTF